MKASDVADALGVGIRRLSSGEHPLPVYLFGGPGLGKSHHLALAAKEARARGVDVHVVPEDIPSPRDADELWSRMLASPRRPWADPAGVGRAEIIAPRGRTVVLVEGLDRLLDAIGDREQKRLRGLFDAHPDAWLVATGSQLTTALIGRDQAFYGWFQVFPLMPWEDTSASDFLDSRVGDLARRRGWPARRSALVTLTGGNPRALVRVARAVRDAPDDTLRTLLESVLDGQTARYRPAFRSFAGNEQRLLEVLVRAPRCLGPTDLAGALGGHSSTWSTSAYRLADAGVLSVRQEGRHAWYSVADPLFRHWLDTRLSAPEVARVAWLCPLLERACGDADAITRAVDLLMERTPASLQEAEGAVCALALVRIRHRRPDRYGEIAAAHHEGWELVVRDAELLHAQLVSPRPLHPELARVEAAISETS